MNLVISNRGNEAVPVMSTDEGGWCESALPGEPLTLTKDKTNDLVIGDKPDVSEQIRQGLGVAAKALKEILHLRKPTPQTTGAALPEVNCIIGNNGPNTIRVILGDGQSDAEVAPGVNYSASAPGYIEIRELGLVNEPGGTPD
jgi:hypothetical protein